jgi:predicted ester cyclase
VLDGIVNNVIKAGKADRFADYLTEDYQFYQAGQTSNRDQYISFMKGLFLAFSKLDAQFEILEIGRSTAVVLELITGVHTGPFNGIPATGKQVSFTVMRTLYFRDGKIKYHWAQGDFTKIPGQLSGAIQAKTVKRMHNEVANASTDVQNCQDSASERSIFSLGEDLQNDLMKLAYWSTSTGFNFRLSDRFGLDQAGEDSLAAAYKKTEAIFNGSKQTAAYHVVFAGKKYFVLYGNRTVKGSSGAKSIPEMAYGGWCAGGNGAAYLQHLVWQGDFPPLSDN